MFKKLVNSLAASALVIALIAPAGALGGSVTLTSKVANTTEGTQWSAQVDAKAGDTLGYLMTVRNTTAMTITNLMARVQLPAELDYVSGSAIYSYPDADGQSKTVAVADSIVTDSGANLMDVPAATQVYVAYKAKVKTNVVDGLIYGPSNQIKADNGLALSNNDARFTATAEVSGQDPEVVLSAALDTYLYNLTQNKRTYTKSVEANRGDELIYRVTIRNTGNQVLTNTGFRVQIPAGLEFVSGYSRYYYGDNFENITLSDAIVSDGGVILMDIPAQMYRYVTYKVRVADNANAGVFATSNQFQSNSRAVNLSSNEGRVTVVADSQPVVTKSLAIEALVSDSISGFSKYLSAKRGDTVTLRVNFTNNGNTDLTNIRIANALPNYMSLVSGSLKVTVNGAVISTSDSVLSAGVNLGNLAVGANGSVEFKALISSETPESVTQLNYTATGNATGITQVSSLATVNLAGENSELPDTGTPGSVVALILLAMFIAIASYIYMKESNGLTKALRAIKR